MKFNSIYFRENKHQILALRNYLKICVKKKKDLLGSGQVSYRRFQSRAFRGLEFTARKLETGAYWLRTVLAYLLITMLEMHFQLPQIEQDGADNGRRFRVENGNSPGEKEEVRQGCLMIKRSSFFRVSLFHLSRSVPFRGERNCLLSSHFVSHREMSFVTTRTIFTSTDVRLAEYADTGKPGIPNALVLQVLPGQT